MKKNLLFVLALGFGVTATAGNGASKIVPISNKALVNKAVPFTKEIDNQEVAFSSVNYKNSVAAPHVMAAPAGGVDEVIGGTFYDLGTNRSIPNRLIVNADGTIGAVWTYANSAGPSFPDRGTGYVYYDGTAWSTPPTARLENKRTGWGGLAVAKDGKEATVAHDGTASTIVMTRGAKGTGAWTQKSINYFDVWPRVVCGGSNGSTLHVISQTTGEANPPYKGQDGAIVYYRSQDWGQTWDKDRFVIPEIDSASYIGFGGDQYAMDSKGDTIVIVAGGLITDVVMVKSTDNGNTWTKTIINPFPITKWNPKKKISDVNNDNVADTIMASDGSIAVAIDRMGKVHVAFGRMRILGKDTAGFSYFPYTDGLMYWQEGWAQPEIVASILDKNGNNTIDLPVDTTHYLFGTYQVSLTSHPQIAFDVNNKPIIVYSSIAEGTDDGSARAYRHTYAIGMVNDSTFSYPLDLVNDDFAEGVFAAAYKYTTADNHLHLIYQRDFHAGHSLSKTGTAQTDPDNDGKTVNDIVYLNMIADTIFAQKSYVGISEKDLSKSISLYPNPANNVATFTINMEKSAVVNVTVYNVLGENVANYNNSTLPAGENKLSINLANYKPGVYFVNATLNGQSVTKRLVVN